MSGRWCALGLIQYLFYVCATYCCLSRIPMEDKISSVARWLWLIIMFCIFCNSWENFQCAYHKEIMNATCGGCVRSSDLSNIQDSHYPNSTTYTTNSYNICPFKIKLIEKKTQVWKCSCWFKEEALAGLLSGNFRSCLPLICLPTTLHSLPGSPCVVEADFIIAI